MKNIKSLHTGFLLLLSLIIISCGYEPEVQRAGEFPQYNTVEVLDLRGYSILNEAIVHAGLNETILNSDSVTLFAPTNTAFEALLSELNLGSITEVPAETLAEILSYHVVPNPLFSSELSRSIPSLSGDVIYVANDASLNGKAIVSEPDMVSSNTIIHGINKVLTVPAGNLFQQMQANDSLSVLVSAIEAANLQSLFTGNSEFTIFAPTNEAFEGVDLSALSTEELTEILSFHVVSSLTFSQELPANARVASLLGSHADGIQELEIVDETINGTELISKI